jgi:hypothetical protein
LPIAVLGVLSTDTRRALDQLEALGCGHGV